MVIYFLEKCLSFFCCLLPECVCEWLGKALGTLTWPLVPKRRRDMARKNVMDCLGVSETEAERIAKASWVRFGPMAFEVLRFPRFKGRLSQRVTLEGLDEVKKVLALGRGVVFATSHCGNWELLGGALAEAGIPLVAVGMKQKESGSDRFITENRRLVGMHVTYKSDVREMFKLLKDGWGIGLLMDQDVSTRDGIIIDWFGRPTNFAQGPATLARHQNLPIIPIYIARLADGTHKGIIHPPIPVAHTDDKKADILEATREVGRVLEAHIRQYPEEWFWLHDRWKSVRWVQEHGDDWIIAHDRWHSAQKMRKENTE
ncbi:MAG: lysophospholipid acyltransferase family protein [Schwartzia sp.]|nr:lysophospholipid acyltransferase family protein [Schwartzia sp. (in: firmicutes)]